MSGPLAGIAVLDLSRALAGPFCTALLADMGATIIKVESAKGGDVTRAWPPFEGSHSLYFDSINRGKSSIAIDFYTEQGRALLHKLALSADVVVENFRTGVMATLGLDPAELRARKPSLVIASVSGFGATGPLSQSAGLDQVAQGMSGLISITGADPENTYRFGIPIIDSMSGAFCAFGIASALAQRERTGEGAEISTSLLESALAITSFQGQRYLSTGEVPGPHGNDHPSLTPYGAFEAADHPITIAVGSDKQWKELCALLGAPSLAADPEFTTGRQRSAHRERVKAAIEDRLRLRPGAEWIEALRDAGIPCGPIYTFDQVFEDAQVKALNMVQHLNRADGSKLPLIRGPLSVNKVPTPISAPPPALGAQSRAVLSGLDFSDDEINDLLDHGIVVEPQAVAVGAVS
ncbi:CaiB/BaiF CoA transferase family protein [Glaciibacter sp. 2TAF33]|uniref:CaiB/BaiF CoA transferase family protein n=1 Tax=Glaciibacter sp. 2TAF33 TaxID=3233015 RepID=UPI003F9070BB